MNWPLLLLLVAWAHAHQTSMTTGGTPLFWANPSVPIQINTNTTDLSSATIKSIVQSSMSEWNSTGVVSATASNSSNNQIVFSSDFSIYGPAVIGITEISYNSSGAINKAVILLNDSYTFTNNPSSFGSTSIFLGDVVTHELGHFFGLSHSEVLGASMFYTSFPGQSTIGADDRSGIHGKYGGGSGSISGRVQGGNSIGVLGVHVQAISAKTGEAIGVFTDENGEFKFEGLSIDDTYYIYTSPLKHVESLPGYFANVQKEFCPGAYTGSFFSKCGREYEGSPQGITLHSGSRNVDVGVVTINCGLKANEDYSYQKLQTSFAPVEAWSSSEGSITEKSFVGYFMKTDSTGWSGWETLRIDLSGVPIGFSRHLRVKLVAQPFGNLMEYEMKLLHNNIVFGSTGVNYSLLLGTYSTDMELSIPLSLDPNQNVFDVQVRGRKMVNSMIPLTFPSPSLFGSDEHMPYLLLMGIWENSDPLLNTEAFLSDNESCLDAPFTYKVTKTKALSENAIATGSSDGGPAASSCGTIDPPGGSGPTGGLAALTLGFMLALLFGSLGKKTKNFLS